MSNKIHQKKLPMTMVKSSSLSLSKDQKNKKSQKLYKKKTKKEAMKTSMTMKTSGLMPKYTYYHRKGQSTWPTESAWHTSH